MKLPYFLVSILALSLAGCASPNGKRERAAAAGGHIDEILAGEWVGDRNTADYLMFKPDPMESHIGRFSGIDDYDHYRLTNRLSMGGKISLELLSSFFDSDRPTLPVQIFFGPDFQSMTLVMPGATSERAPTSHRYRRGRP
jgi:hypothetical protein